MRHFSFTDIGVRREESQDSMRASHQLKASSTLGFLSGLSHSESKLRDFCGHSSTEGWRLPPERLEVARTWGSRAETQSPLKPKAR